MCHSEAHSAEESLALIGYAVGNDRDSSLALLVQNDTLQSIQIFSAIRNRALRARGLLNTSASDATIGLRVIKRSAAER